MSDYSDDFDDYEDDDFEEYEGDSEVVETHDNTRDADLEPEKPVVAVVQPSFPLDRPVSARPGSAALPAKSGGAVGGLVGGAPVRPPAGFGRSVATKPAPKPVESYRVSMIRKLVTLESVSFDLFNLNPKSAYELALLSSVSNATSPRFVQQETQTGFDLVESTAQTDDIEMTETQVQCPDDTVMMAPAAALAKGSGSTLNLAGSQTNLAGGGDKKRKKGDKKKKDAAVDWTPKLARFVTQATDVFETLLKATEDDIQDEVQDVSSGLHVLHQCPVPPEHQLATIVTSAWSPHLAALVFVQPSTPTTPARSIIHLSPLRQLDSPQTVLACWGRVTTFTFAPHAGARSLAFAGTDDGVVYCWDTRTRSRDPVWGSFMTLSRAADEAFADPAAFTLHYELESGHKSAVVAVHVFDNTVLSVDEQGWMITWTLVPRREHAAAPGAATAGPPLELVWGAATRLVWRPPHVPAALVRATAVPVTLLDPATGAVLAWTGARESRGIVRAGGPLGGTREARDHYELGSDVQVTCMAWVEFGGVGVRRFAVGCASGHVALFAVDRSTPLAVWWVARAPVLAVGAAKVPSPRMVAVTSAKLVTWTVSAKTMDLDVVEETDLPPPSLAKGGSSKKLATVVVALSTAASRLLVSRSSGGGGEPVSVCSLPH
ncbi:hypothetical protein H9P43_009704 [Blastocladiella emersonii ATCC 22665]|nr:hypothetical protein H9P43_009704 [Blastocladiella emersonii ATCC 22665]